MARPKKEAPKPTKKKAREVERVISSEEIIRNGWHGMIGGGRIELRLNTKGIWSVHYPEEGWMPCMTDCNTKHKHSIERPMVECFTKTQDENEAWELARSIAAGREIMIIVPDKVK